MLAKRLMGMCCGVMDGPAFLTRRDTCAGLDFRSSQSPQHGRAGLLFWVKAEVKMWAELSPLEALGKASFHYAMDITFPLHCGQNPVPVVVELKAPFPQ